MLQRAASNAYSWWWASHIRTKQSKWLEQSLQDMEEKVAETLKIIDDDGDSFAKRAEMYYRKRPELIAFVEESFKAYRALAERYDHISKELQSANRTIASVFPDRVQYQMEEDDEEEIGQGTPTSPSNDPNNSTQNKTNIPKVPKTPKKDFRSPSMLLSRKVPLRRLTSSSRHVSTPISGLSKAEALSEIDRLQKDILALQTEKEFVRSLYERAYNKYWEIEDQITETQKRVCSLQDEFGIGTVIEDDDARTLMAATALRSCNETLAKLKEIQAKSSIEAKVEYQRVKDAHEKFEKLRDEFISKHMSHQDICDWNKSDNLGSEHRIIDEDMARMDQETHDMGLLREKIKEKLELDSNSSLTVTEMAERIDELVNKVVTLETAVSSQDALVRRLRSETDELQKHIQNLEEEKEMLIASSDNMNKKLKELAEELKKVKDLNRNVRHQDNSLQTHFTEATCNLEHLSGRLQNVKPDEETENLVLYKKKSSKNKPGKQSEEHRKLSVEDSAILDDFSTTKDKKEDNAANLINNANLVPGRIQKLIQQEKDYKEDLSDTVSAPDIESQDLGAGEEDQPNWRQMFINSLDDREKILLEEYTSVLLNYKDVRAKLNDVEKKNRDSIFELALQVRELKGALATKDKEIHFLHHKLNGPESNPDESPFTTYTEYKYTPQEGLFQGSAEASNLQDPDVASQYLDAKAARTSAAEQNAEITGIIGISSGNLKDISRKENLLKVRLNQVDNRQGLSNLEKKFRSDIDDLLEENLEFWLRFSTSVHQIQKFQNSIQDLQAELFKIKNKNRSEGNSTARQQWMQSEMRPIFRHMREIRTELSLWLEHNAVLQDELQGRYSSLCNIQDDITRASSNADSEAEKAELSGYQAAKFQGEILNMKQENNKVASELQAGLSLVKGLKNEVEKTLAELDEALGINKYNQPRKKDSSSRARIPLRSFLFGVKLKKQKQSSLFACVNPTLQKQYSDLAAASNLPIERETD